MPTDDRRGIDAQRIPSDPRPFRALVRAGRLHIEWLASWDEPWWPRFGGWRVPGGFTLRYRGWLLGWWR